MSLLTTQLSIRTKRDFWKIPAGYLLFALIGVLPLLIAMSAGYIGELLGCTVNEAGTHPCKVFGVDIGTLLSILFIFFWLSLITLPLGALLILFWTVRSVRETLAFYKRNRRHE